MPSSTGSVARAGRRYVVRVTLVMVAYSAVLFAALEVFDLLPPGSIWRYVVVLAPVVPLVFVAWAVIRLMRESDELQRRIGLEAMATAFAIGSLLTFGYGMLQIAGAPAVSWLFVWPVYGACWLVTGFVARGRY